MSFWYSDLFKGLLGFAVKAVEDPDVQSAGKTVFQGIAKKIAGNINNPAELHNLAAALDKHAPELVGVVVANTDAAKLIPPELLPPPDAGKK